MTNITFTPSNCGCYIDYYPHPDGRIKMCPLHDAAPELLAALTELLGVFPYEVRWSAQVEPAVKRAGAAIAKAS